MSKIYHLEINGQHSYYTTLTGVCVNDIGVSKFTLDRYDFKEPYMNGICVIRKGVLNIGAKMKKPGIKTAPVIEQKKTNIKINILPGTYIKKDQYYFNVDGEILDEKQFLNRYGKKYNLPTKIIGDIENLKITL